MTNTLMARNHFFSPKGDESLFRYLSFIKFQSLVERSALFFSRMDRMSDPEEGTMYERFGENRTVYGVCWRIADFGDCGRLFKEYGAEDGVIIRIALRRLMGFFRIYAVSPLPLGPPKIIFPYVVFAKVCYRDLYGEGYNIDPEDREVFWAQFSHNGEHHLKPYLLKRKCFEFERELRIITHWQTITLDGPTYLSENAVFERGGETLIAPCRNINEIYQLEKQLLGRPFAEVDDIDKMQPVGFFYQLDLDVIEEIYVPCANRARVVELLHKFYREDLVARITELD